MAKCRPRAPPDRPDSGLVTFRGFSQPMLYRLRSALPQHRHGCRSVLRHNDGPRAILALLVLILASIVLLLVVQRIETTRRTGTTAALVTLTTFQGPSSFEQSPSGTWIRYQYVVDGVPYRGLAFRRWANVASHQPKVCFDPTNPKDHVLVDDRVRCGTDSGP